MLKLKSARPKLGIRLVEASPLRRADPRTRLALSLGVSLGVMLPPERLLLFAALYAGFLGWARLLPEAIRQVWRLRWVIVLLWGFDVLFVDLALANSVALRLLLLTGVLTLITGTTTPVELRLALERLCVPYRYAFSLSLAFQSVSLLEEEWRAIREAQQARGAWSPEGLTLRHLGSRLSGMVALIAPAVVLSTRRAWAMTEAASARGLDAPGRRPYHRLAMRAMDWLLLGAIAAILLTLWRW